MIRRWLRNLRFFFRRPMTLKQRIRLEERIGHTPIFMSRETKEQLERDLAK